MQYKSLETFLKQQVIDTANSSKQLKVQQRGFLPRGEKFKKLRAELLRAGHVSRYTQIIYALVRNKPLNKIEPHHTKNPPRAYDLQGRWKELKEKFAKEHGGSAHWSLPSHIRYR